MKKLSQAVPFGLAFLLAAGTASANTGTIQFSGEIKSGTCPIEIIDPVSGGVGGVVPLGIAVVAKFPTADSEANERGFGMRISPGAGCTITAGNAKVNFVSQSGPAGAGSDLYALHPYSNAATGVAVVIKDRRDGTIIAHGADSKEFALETTKPTVMSFMAAYKSTAPMANITPGAADAFVNFVVTLP